mmetsp:Transcript_9005/g.27312  ORF Transcript_9005/g.27312 Transcript_9005/m.27312 type:complete len:261 (-) Transcript_9005:217-999(-)
MIAVGQDPDVLAGLEALETDRALALHLRSALERDLPELPGGQAGGSVASAVHQHRDPCPRCAVSIAGWVRVPCALPCCAGDPQQGVGRQPKLPKGVFQARVHGEGCSPVEEADLQAAQPGQEPKRGRGLAASLRGGSLLKVGVARFARRPVAGRPPVPVEEELRRLQGLHRDDGARERPQADRPEDPPARGLGRNGAGHGAREGPDQCEDPAKRPVQHGLQAARDDREERDALANSRLLFGLLAPAAKRAVSSIPPEAAQ